MINTSPVAGRPCLTLVRGRDKGESFEVDGPVMLLGRDAGCQVILGSMSVSRRHARIVEREDARVIEDLGSTGGTTLNGAPIDGPTPLTHGDLIQLGDCVLRYASPASGPTQPASGETILHQRDSSATGEWALVGIRPEEKLRALLQICRDIDGPLDLEDVLARTLECLFRLFPKAERGFILVDEGDGFEPKASRTRDDAVTPSAPSRTALRHAITTGKAILSEDILVDDRFNGSRSVDDARLRTLMCVPLRDYARRAIGAIEIDASDAGSRFTAEDLDLLVAVAGQVGMAVENARLRSSARESLRRQVQDRAFVDAMLAAAPAAIAFFDPGLRFVRANEAMGELSGRPVPQHIGRLLGEVGGEMARRLEPILRSVAETGLPVVGSEIAVGESGRWLCHCYPADDADGVGIGIGLILEDVSAARMAQLELEKSERRYRLLFEANPQPMWVYDLETLRFMAVNEAAIRRYGYSLDEFLAMTIVDIRPADDVPALRERIASVGQATYLNAAGWRHVTKAGETLDVEISSHSIRFSGRAARLVLASDITQRVRAEAAVIAGREAAEAANRAKDRFLAVLSHELRTPLTPVLLAATSLASDSSLAPDHREAMGMIRRNVELEARLVDDLLDVARIGRGDLRLDLKPVDLHEALKEAWEICSPEAGAAGLEVAWELAADEHHARADPGRIKQVFWNIIRNAARYARGGGHLLIHTSNPVPSGSESDQSSPCIALEFVDDGIGIAPEHLECIFEPFERGGGNGVADDGGLGLGLAIGRSIVSGHGGLLTADSPGPGLGATFRMTMATIPRRSHDLGETPPPPAHAANVKGKRVLVVEDNADTRNYLGLVLRRDGFEVVATRDLESARAALKAGGFALIVSDIQLPDGSGLDLMSELDAARRTPGISISGYGSEDDISASARVGFAFHLTKPVTVERLRSAIARVLACP